MQAKPACAVGQPVRFCVGRCDSQSYARVDAYTLSKGIETRLHALVVIGWTP